MTLETLINQLPRINTRAARDFAKLGVHTVHDLIMHVPFRHEDFSHIVEAGKLKIGERGSVRCQVLVVENRRSPRKHRLFTEALFRDESGSVKAVWFNQPYLPKILRRGDWVYLSGTLEESYFGVHLTNPIFEHIRPGEETIHAGRLVPVYHTRGALTSRQIRNLVSRVLPVARQFMEWLPESIRATNNFMPLAEALRGIHFPKDASELHEARRRLAFNELFLAQLVACRARGELDRAAAPVIPFNEASTRAFVATLPFKLTEDQRRATWEILQDMTRPRPMNRLLQGEVGSGKTVVAAIAVLNAALAGFSTLYLAPTEILAEQHATTLRTLLRGFPVRVGLLTAGVHLFDGEPVPREALESKISAGEVELVIGTHTLLVGSHSVASAQLSSEATRWLPPRIGLAIVDEQHRFGVLQRKRLRDEGGSDRLPHLLSMTATPIPRTLALTAYGDLDFSEIRELPKERKPVATQLIREAERARTYEWIRGELERGRQGFVICPLISESDKLGVRAATKEFERLQQIFPEFSLGLLHGKLSTEEKQRVMHDFKEGRVKLLVATAVVEVGIDVPRATIMVIEGAERFGLAQLHQFRGRVGRGTLAAHCFLFTETDTIDARERLLIFARTTDGFALAERDLELRGPGELFGKAQSGFPRFMIAKLEDTTLLERAREATRALINEDPDLDHHPLLRDGFTRLAKEIHLE